MLHVFASPPPSDSEHRSRTHGWGVTVQLVMPMPIMIWLAVIVEAAIGNWVDMIILLFIQFVNAGIGWCAPALASYQTSSQAAMILAQI